MSGRAGAKAPKRGVASPGGLPTTDAPPRPALRHQRPKAGSQAPLRLKTPLALPDPQEAAAATPQPSCPPASFGGSLWSLSRFCPTQAYSLSQPHTPLTFRDAPARIRRATARVPGLREVDSDTLNAGASEGARLGAANRGRVPGACAVASCRSSGLASPLIGRGDRLVSNWTTC